MQQFTLFFVVHLTALFASTACIDYDGFLNMKLEHSLNCNDEKFCHRGSITLKSIRTGVPIIDQILFNEKHLEALKKLANEDEFYSIKTTITTGENSKGTEYLSSVKAQAFLENGLSDVINAWILPNGAVIAVNFQVANSTQPLKQATNEYKLNSKFYLRYIEQAPVPDTASYIQKMERDREAREKGEMKDNRSFLAKYWMYIVPVAIFVMISGATNPEASAPAGR
ncbi:ER membrane protein complex subunit 10 [Bombyx mandarina]|uniref:ER membrane protein complex subunit 10 n=1 Tax=Bombyx mandarina TaxID=7092 RepID=A0A6J2K9H2_BOMMA|nr:ER membrane protein complex subunit 10 [Bombyx mandarina]